MALSKKIYLLTALALAAILTGCGWQNIGYNGGGNRPSTIMPMPGNSEIITQSPMTSQNNQSANYNGGYGDYSNTGNVAANNGNINTGMVASNSNEASIPGLVVPIDALDLTPAMIAGVWHASIDGMVCQIATPQTKFGKGYRVASLRCPASFMHVASWSVSGKQLNLYNANGQLNAVLYGTNTYKFEGMTVDGRPVTLSR